MNGSRGHASLLIYRLYVPGHFTNSGMQKQTLKSITFEPIALPFWEFTFKGALCLKSDSGARAKGFSRSLNGGHAKYSRKCKQEPFLTF